MTDSILTKPDRQEALSKAYVQTIAASAGYSTAVPNIDRDSVDLTISAGGEMRPRLDLQLKATTSLRLNGSNFSFVLSLKNYNDLRSATQTPRLLVVLDMPKSEHAWLNVNVKRLILRRSAYWISLRGWPESENRASETIQIPNTNVFNVETLRELMDQSRHGVLA